MHISALNAGLVAAKSYVLVAAGVATCLYLPASVRRPLELCGGVARAACR
jgi:hypothetical protein